MSNTDETPTVGNPPKPMPAKACEDEYSICAHHTPVHCSRCAENPEEPATPPAPELPPALARLEKLLAVAEARTLVAERDEALAALADERARHELLVEDLHEARATLEWEKIAHEQTASRLEAVHAAGDRAALWRAHEGVRTRT